MIPPLLFVALDFYRDPRRFGHLRDARAPLPDGITELLGAPAGCLGEEEVAGTVAATGADEDELRAAVTFFVKQVLLEPQGDYYRVLGVPRDAEPALIKQHYYYLMRLFHPDRDVDGDGWDDLYAPRINEAYQVLRHGEKRAAYDASLAPADGFNPEELGEAEAGWGEQGAEPAGAGFAAGRAGPAAGVAGRGGAAAPSLAVRGGWYTKPWLYAGLVGVVLVVMLGLYLGRPSDGVTLAVAPADSVPNGAADAARRGGGAGPTEGEVVAVDGEVAPAGETRSVWRAEAASDAAIEAMVRQRVEQATIAVLGAPRPERAEKPAAREEPRTVAEMPAVKEPAVEEPAVVEVAAVADEASVGATRPDQEAPLRPAAEAVAAAGPLLGEIEVIAGPRREVEPFPALAAADADADADAGRDGVVAPTGGHGIEARVEPVLEPGPPPINDDEVASLMARLVMSYERGDAAAFAALFTSDAETTDADGRGAIEALYGDFFATLAGSRFELTRMRWSEPALEREGAGRATILTRMKEGDVTNTVRLTMRFTVRREHGGVRISRMDYE